MVFKPGTWQAEHYKGLPRYEGVGDGQYFPEAASQKRLDAIAERRAEVLSSAAAVTVTRTAATVELPQPEPEARPEANIPQPKPEVVAAAA